MAIAMKHGNPQYQLGQEIFVTEAVVLHRTRNVTDLHWHKEWIHRALLLIKACDQAQDEVEVFQVPL